MSEARLKYIADLRRMLLGWRVTGGVLCVLGAIAVLAAPRLGQPNLVTAGWILIAAGWALFLWVIWRRTRYVRNNPPPA